MTSPPAWPWTARSPPGSCARASWWHPRDGLDAPLPVNSRRLPGGLRVSAWVSRDTQERNFMELFQQMADMGHERVLFCSSPEVGFHAIIAVHSTVLGPGLGGVRMHPYNNMD